MLASTWTDMVMGVDIHFEMVPTPAGPVPTPFPNPFIGVVFDPIESPSLWAIGPGERVRLLHQDGTVLGPDVPFIPWLEDQVADLEYAWENRAELSFPDYVWLGG